MANKYPVSVNNFQCLGPCYNKNVSTIHPITLEVIKNKNYSFCPVNPYDEVDSETGQIINNVTDQCMKPTHNKNIPVEEQTLNILTPLMDFDTKRFVKHYYKINSLNESIDWVLNNQNKPYVTLTRVLNASLHAFGKDIELIDPRFNNLFIDYIKKIGIKDLYNVLHKYIYIGKDDKVLFGNAKKNTLSKNDNIIERTNFIIKTFINDSDINKFINRYFEHRKKQWLSIRKPLSNMIEELSQNIIKKIEQSV
jgi:hypothetical protein